MPKISSSNAHDLIVKFFSKHQSKNLIKTQKPLTEIVSFLTQKKHKSQSHHRFRKRNRVRRRRKLEQKKLNLQWRKWDDGHSEMWNPRDHERKTNSPRGRNW